MNTKITYFVSTFLLFWASMTVNAQAKLGDNPTDVNPNVLLELESSDKGLLIPRLTDAQRDSAFTSIVPEGLLIYNTTADCLQLFSNNSWNCIGGTTGALTLTGNILSLNNSSVDLSDLLSNEALSLDAGDATTSVIQLGTSSITLKEGRNITLTESGNTITIAAAGGGGGSGGGGGAAGTDDQKLSLSGNVLTLEDGGSVTLPVGVNTDNQTLSVSGTTLSISGGNSVALVSETDAQTLSVMAGTTSQSILSLTNGGQAIFEAGSNIVLTEDPLTKTIFISATGSLTAGTDDQNLMVGAGTASTSLIQIETGSGIALEAGNNITLSEPNSSTIKIEATEKQTLTLTGTGLFISGTNSVSLAAFDNTGTDSQSLTFMANTATMTTLTLDQSPSLSIITSGTLTLNTTNSSTLELIGGTSGYLDKITENGKTGYRILNRNPDFYGDIGLEAVDLSFSNTVTNTFGAKGDYSFTTGINNIASGDYSTSMGISSTASGSASFAVGYGASAKGHLSIAMGEETIASGYASVAMGFKTKANGDESFTTGRFNDADGDASTAMGSDTKALGNISTSMGSLTEALGFASTAMGESSVANGNVSTAMGNSTTASGTYSTAMGSVTNASGSISTAMGLATTASGYTSTSMGLVTTASGEISTAMGRSTFAESYGQTTIGIYSTSVTPTSATAWDANDRLFVIGNGTGTSSRKDALVMLKNGNTTLNGDFAVSGSISKVGGTTYHPDYVFEKVFDGYSQYNSSYELMPLDQLELYIKKNKHLPGVQSRAEIQAKKSWNVSENVRTNLEKIEELYLHTIEQQKQIEAQQKEITALKDMLSTLLKKME